METRYEIVRAVSLLRSLLRMELEEYATAMRDGDADRAQKRMAAMREKLTRAINVLNQLR